MKQLLATAAGAPPLKLNKTADAPHRSHNSLCVCLHPGDKVEAPGKAQHPLRHSHSKTVASGPGRHLAPLSEDTTWKCVYLKPFKSEPPSTPALGTYHSPIASKNTRPVTHAHIRAHSYDGILYSHDQEKQGPCSLTHTELFGGKLDNKIE